MPGKRRVHPRRFKTLPQDTEAAVGTAPVFGARCERSASADEELAHGLEERLGNMEVAVAGR
jgi:hypothetical protein